MARFLFQRLLPGFLAVGVLLASHALAVVHMNDPFLTGVDPSSGQYALGNVVGQNPTVSNFNSAWTDGLTTTQSGMFDVVGSGLTWPGLVGVDGGAVQFVNDLGATTTQAAVRTFTNSDMTADGNYWLSCMMSFDQNFYVDATSSAFTGMLNAEEGDPSVTLTGGFQFGFVGNATGGVDAVIRVRDKVPGSNPTTYAVRNILLASDVQPGNHLFVAYIDSEYQVGKSNDWTRAWLDPTITSGWYSAGEPTHEEEMNNWFPPTYPDRIADTLVFNATNLGANAAVTYDQARFGDTWAEVVGPSVNESGAVLIANPIDGYDHVATYVREWQETVNFGTSDVIQVGSVLATEPETTKAMRGILSFSLDSVPEGTKVSGATLKLAVSRIDETDGEVTQIDLYLADLPDGFDENQANWLRAGIVDEIFDVPWTNSPGDPTSTVLSSVVDPASDATEVTFASSAAFVAAVQAAIDNNVPLDLALLAPFENSGLRQFIEFYSDDASDYFLHPALILTFGEPVWLPGDTDGDGSVDDDDAAVVAQHWLQTGLIGKASVGDFNEDGTVDDRDAAILAAHWVRGTGGSEGAVPEPSTLVLAAAGLVMLWMRRRSG